MIGSSGDDTTYRYALRERGHFVVLESAADHETLVGQRHARALNELYLFAQRTLQIRNIDAHVHQQWRCGLPTEKRHRTKAHHASYELLLANACCLFGTKRERVHLCSRRRRHWARQRANAVCLLEAQLAGFIAAHRRRRQHRSAAPALFHFDSRQQCGHSVVRLMSREHAAGQYGFQNTVVWVGTRLDEAASQLCVAARNTAPRTRPAAPDQRQTRPKHSAIVTGRQTL